MGRSKENVGQVEELGKEKEEEEEGVTEKRKKRVFFFWLLYREPCLALSLDFNLFFCCRDFALHCKGRTTVREYARGMGSNESKRLHN